MSFMHATRRLTATFVTASVILLGAASGATATTASGPCCWTKKVVTGR